eukprot:CAMPEP_0175868988 /NCGR_PEP_ID=MMETSP0107_2-20121207/35701_1 /TAXON_ID=195067 ORGANISM="Goniomonas pacifica, Strain CCMP1869" /NCGR_SAMPLE_ID=MMETSP0107_2 /ASSEMBLY_ACC=CAM_ASM_000203 /LENGTH=40 /DNA_ID= /DNA_START= /DNA_END= /DNA_ORIENTATION=
MVATASKVRSLYSKNRAAACPSQSSGESKTHSPIKMQNPA